jgi:dihydroxyacetone kinase
MKRVRHHPSRPVSVLHNNIGRCPAMNLNLFLSKESKSAKDVGTTVDKTIIPV